MKSYRLASVSKAAPVMRPRSKEPAIPLLHAFYLRVVVWNVSLSAGGVCSAALSGITAPFSTTDSSSKSNANEARPSLFPSVVASDRRSLSPSPLNDPLPPRA